MVARLGANKPIYAAAKVVHVVGLWIKTILNETLGYHSGVAIITYIMPCWLVPLLSDVVVPH